MKRICMLSYNPQPKVALYSCRLNKKFGYKRDSTSPISHLWGVKCKFRCHSAMASCLYQESCKINVLQNLIKTKISPEERRYNFLMLLTVI